MLLLLLGLKRKGEFSIAIHKNMIFIKLPAIVVVASAVIVSKELDSVAIEWYCPTADLFASTTFGLVRMGCLTFVMWPVWPLAVFVAVPVDSTVMMLLAVSLIDRSAKHC